MDSRSLSKGGCDLFDLLFQSKLVKNEPIGNIILVNVAYVLNRLTANPFGSYNFNISKPDIGIETHLAGLLAEFGHFGRTGIVAGKSKSPLV